MSKNISKRRNCVFIGGLPLEVTERAVRNYFEHFGEVRGVVLNKVKQEQKDSLGDSLLEFNDEQFSYEKQSSHRGCGFVEFDNFQVVQSVTRLKDHTIMGHKIDCRIAMTNNERKNYQKSIMNEKRKVFIGKLPTGVSKEDIYSYFSRFSEIEEVTLIYKREKNFGICFILFKQNNVGEKLTGKQFEISTGVFVECELALNPQQLHQRKLQEGSSCHTSEKHTESFPKSPIQKQLEEPEAVPTTEQKSAVPKKAGQQADEALIATAASYNAASSAKPSTRQASTTNISKKTTHQNSSCTLVREATEKSLRNNNASTSRKQQLFAHPKREPAAHPSFEPGLVRPPASSLRSGDSSSQSRRSDLGCSRSSEEETLSMDKDSGNNKTNLHLENKAGLDAYGRSDRQTNGRAVNRRAGATGPAKEKESHPSTYGVLKNILLRTRPKYYQLFC